MHVLNPVEPFTTAAVACPAAGLTTVATITNEGRKLLCFQFDVATQALDDFDVLVRFHASAQQIDITPADWAALPAGGRFRRSSGNLAAVAAAGNGWFEMEMDGIVEVVVKASGAVNNASVTPYWSVQ